jgi:hypothetical protein
LYVVCSLRSTNCGPGNRNAPRARHLSFPTLRAQLPHARNSCANFDARLTPDDPRPTHPPSSLIELSFPFPPDASHFCLFLYLSYATCRCCYASCSATTNQAREQPVSQFQYFRLLSFHGRVSKAYHTKIVKGAPHPLSRRSGRASLGEATVANRCEQQSSSCTPYYAWGTGPLAAPMYSLLSGIAARLFPATQTHLRLRPETENCYRPTAFTEIPYGRRPNTNEQTDHHLDVNNN